MAYKKTVAIIGATTTLGRLLAGSVLHQYRLLLVDTSADELHKLQHQLQEPETEVETIQCSKEASWEADVVVVVVEDTKLPAVSEKIKAVTTCKPVIHFSAAKGQSLQQLLPHARVITVLHDEPISSNMALQSAFLKGTDSEGLSIAQSLLALMGCAQSVAAKTS